MQIGGKGVGRALHKRPAGDSDDDDGGGGRQGRPLKRQPPPLDVPPVTLPLELPSLLSRTASTGTSGLTEFEGELLSPLTTRRTQGGTGTAKSELSSEIQLPGTLQRTYSQATREQGSTGGMPGASPRETSRPRQAPAGVPPLMSPPAPPLSPCPRLAAAAAAPEPPAALPGTSAIEDGVRIVAGDVELVPETPRDAPFASSGEVGGSSSEFLDGLQAAGGVGAAAAAAAAAAGVRQAVGQRAAAGGGRLSRVLSIPHEED
eukprot:COSAG01_NODE_9979_length_2285_cov_1.987649_3_plen_261_part_00